MVGKRIKMLRFKNGYSLKELQNISGVSYVQINRYEMNNAIPSSKVVKKLAKAFNVEIEELTNMTNEVIINKEELCHKFNLLNDLIEDDENLKLALDQIFDAIIFKNTLKKELLLK